jgi:hypothetical protein
MLHKFGEKAPISQSIGEDPPQINHPVTQACYQYSKAPMKSATEMAPLACCHRH